jgi:hypothetical protein
MEQVYGGIGCTLEPKVDSLLVMLSGCSYGINFKVLICNCRSKRVSNSNCLHTYEKVLFSEEKKFRDWSHFRLPPSCFHTGCFNLRIVLLVIHLRHLDRIKDRSPMKRMNSQATSPSALPCTLTVYQTKPIVKCIEPEPASESSIPPISCRRYCLFTARRFLQDCRNSISKLCFTEELL